jgi:hypothetical protein
MINILGDKMKLKIIMKAKDIPVSEKVSKIKGTKIYRIIKNFTIYPGKMSFDIDPNCRILIDTNSPLTGNIISGDTELVWHTTQQNFNMFFENYK